MFSAGVDEAGRGPALGPMAMSIVLASKEQEEKIVSLGVKDSKLVKKEKRPAMAKKIQKIAEESAVLLVEPLELNRLMLRHSLNEIEAMKIGEMINSLKECPELVFVDSPDIIEANFSRRIERYCTKPPLIRSEHFADKNYPLVSAASILAKVARDEAIEALKREFGEIGSGYSHDKATIGFIRKWLKEKKCLPPFARDRWETNLRELDACFQKKLGKW